MANIAKGIDSIGDIAETLNNIITSTGKKIERDNPVIWDGYLHRWDNEDWENMLAAYDAIEQSAPDKIRAWHKTNALKAKTALKKYKNSSDRALDKKCNKPAAWAMIQSFREIWNSLHDINIPNEDYKAKRTLPKVVVNQTQEATHITIFHQLFDVED